MPALRLLAILGAFLAGWALLAEATRWLIPYELPGSRRLHLLLLAGVVLWWLDLLASRGERTPWKPSPDLGRGWRPWAILGGLCLLVWMQRAPLRTLLDGGSLRWPGFGETLLLTVVLAPVVEEHAFRGVLWRAFASTSPGRLSALTALLGSSFAFALWQLPLFQGDQRFDLDPRRLLDVALLGGSFGLLRFGFGGILPGVVVHALFAGLRLLS